MGEYSFYVEPLREWGIERITLAQDAAGAVFYPFRVIVDALALDTRHYLALAREDGRTARGMREIRAPTPGGAQSTIYMRRRELSILLALIDPAQVGKRAKALGTLADFQAALWHLAERVAFKGKASAELGATLAPTVATWQGTRRTPTSCPDCGAPLIAEERGDRLYLWHAGAGDNGEGED